MKKIEEMNAREVNAVSGGSLTVTIRYIIKQLTKPSVRPQA